MASQEAKVVHERREDSLHGPKHGAEAQVEQHEEKQCGPEGTGWEEGHHLSEGDECQACSLHTLQSHEDGGKRQGQGVQLDIYSRFFFFFFSSCSCGFFYPYLRINT